MLMIVYWVGGELYLLDPARADLSLWQAVLISAASLTIGWLVYDFLCKSGLGEKPTFLMVLLFVLLVVISFLFTFLSNMSKQSVWPVVLLHASFNLSILLMGTVYPADGGFEVKHWNYLIALLAAIVLGMSLFNRRVRSLADSTIN